MLRRAPGSLLPTGPDPSGRPSSRRWDTRDETSFGAAQNAFMTMCGGSSGYPNRPPPSFRQERDTDATCAFLRNLPKPQSAREMSTSEMSTSMKRKRVPTFRGEPHATCSDGIAGGWCSGVVARGTGMGPSRCRPASRPVRAHRTRACGRSRTCHEAGTGTHASGQLATYG
jgi:hypothetical protein